MDKHDKVKRDMTAVILIFTVIAIITVIISLNNKPLKDSTGRSYIERNSYGRGRKDIELEAKLKEDKETLSLALEERQYTLEELEEVFDKAAIKAEKLVLGNNKSVDLVKEDLNFITNLPDMAIRVSWQTEENDIIDYNGHIDFTKAKEGNNPVMLNMVLAYGSNEAEHTFYVNVVKDKLSPSEIKKETLEKDLLKKEESTREKEIFILPDKVCGEKIVWKYKKDSKATGIFLLGIVIAACIYMDDKQKVKKKKELREQLMVIDYPDIVSKLTLFINAGMATGNAWRKVVELYLNKREETGVRPAYEEMAFALHEMNQGVSEAECYRQFGIRCNVAVYRKLGTMLASNLRKGNKNISALLKKESFNAFEERKNAARKKGEEASTKLLGPMFIMLTVLLAIIVIPAFLSIRI